MDGNMQSTQLNKTVAIEQLSATNPLGKLFGSDWPYLKIIFLGVLSWFALAQISAYLIPDTTTTLTQNSGQYLDYVIRNGKIYLLIIVSHALINTLKASDQAAKGQSSLPYIRDHIIGGFKNDKIKFIGIPLYFFIAMAIFAAYLFSYSTIKTRIPDMVPYMWDESFRNMDKALFLGKDPWQYFAFLYEHPKIIRTMDFIYDMWATILVSCWFFALRYGGSNKARRYQFVLALLLTWFIGGNILAILLSSGGPVYFEAITGLRSTYSEQLALLSAINEQSPLRAFEYQKLLWKIYESPSVGLGGISAMPSMHCASSFLLLLMFGHGKIMRPLLIGFFALIFISSFVLAWHYALDGILVIPITYACWKLAGWITSKVSRQSL